MAMFGYWSVSYAACAKSFAAFLLADRIGVRAAESFHCEPIAAYAFGDAVLDGRGSRGFIDAGKLWSF